MSHYVHARLEELQCGFEVAQGSTNARGLSVGRLFKLTGQPRQDQNCEYLVLKTDLELEGGEYEAMSGGGAGNFSCRFSVIKSSEPFRPARITPKPIVQGPQTAIVVGPSGDEIYTDKYGRVKVNKILTTCRISPSKTIGGLSERQRSELVSLLHR